MSDQRKRELERLAARGEADKWELHELRLWRIRHGEWVSPEPGDIWLINEDQSVPYPWISHPWKGVVFSTKVGAGGDLSLSCFVYPLDNQRLDFRNISSFWQTTSNLGLLLTIEDMRNSSMIRPVEPYEDLKMVLTKFPTISKENLQKAMYGNGGNE